MPFKSFEVTLRGQRRSNHQVRRTCEIWWKGTIWFTHCLSAYTRPQGQGKKPLPGSPSKEAPFSPTPFVIDYEPIVMDRLLITPGPRFDGKYSSRRPPLSPIQGLKTDATPPSSNQKEAAATKARGEGKRANQDGGTPRAEAQEKARRQAELNKSNSTALLAFLRSCEALPRLHQVVLDATKKRLKAKFE